MIVARECLVDGDVSGENLTDFWNRRAVYLSKAYSIPSTEYYQKSIPEFQKILSIPAFSTVHLWFERDLFCQVNFWFCCSLINRSDVEVFLVIPSKDIGWSGFANMKTAELKKQILAKERLSKDDIQFFNQCWIAFKHNRFLDLKSLADASKFDFIKQAINAHLNRGIEDDNQPTIVLKRIIEDLKTVEFSAIFESFCEREGVYGFTDIHIKRLLTKIQKE
ncbi:hypothetical protein [Ekhidna sp.]|uniref:hypothetical protein n=1 Tax=Ekhidna sp. TaxID=2608089 RepID=UPI003297C479